MDHEVFVPVPAETLRETLRDPARVAGCVQGLQQNADDPQESAGPLSGRLKVRIGNHTITYRGALRIVEQGDVFTVEGEGTEARGAGSVKVALTIGLTETDGGTTLGFTGTSHADGRLAKLPEGSAEQAAHRLLDRFAERLAEVATEQSASDAPGPGSPDAADTEAPSGPSGVSAEETDEATAESAPEASEASASGESDQGGGGESPKDRTEPLTGFDAPVPPPAPGADAAFDESEESADFGGLHGFDEMDSDLSDDLNGLGDDVDEDADGEDDVDEDEDDELGGFGDIPDEPPAEAAHARRTMIGRSAEEVDHAPPRGRYAPTPAPDAATAGLPLRWIAPAAALALASAVVLGRALRRRR
ncbi:SRPBCC domain-containing protein [Streptomyces sp. NPDC004726]